MYSTRLRTFFEVFDDKVNNISKIFWQIKNEGTEQEHSFRIINSLQVKEIYIYIYIQSEKDKFITKSSSNNRNIILITNIKNQHSDI